MKAKWISQNKGTEMPNKGFLSAQSQLDCFVEEVRTLSSVCFRFINFDSLTCLFILFAAG
jgi:hypothetical protein